MTGRFSLSGKFFEVGGNGLVWHSLSVEIRFGYDLASADSPGDFPGGFSVKSHQDQMVGRVRAQCCITSQTLRIPTFSPLSCGVVACDFCHRKHSQSVELSREVSAIGE